MRQRSERGEMRRTSKLAHPLFPPVFYFPLFVCVPEAGVRAGRTARELLGAVACTAERRRQDRARVRLASRRSQAAPQAVPASGTKIVKDRRNKVLSERGLLRRAKKVEEMSEMEHVLRSLTLEIRSGSRKLVVRFSQSGPAIGHLVLRGSRGALSIFSS